MALWKFNQHNHIKFEKEFFDLCFHDKCENLLTLPEEVLTNDYNIDTIVMALLQHSPKELKKQFPVRTANCKKGEKKISRAAQDADIEYRRKMIN